MARDAPVVFGIEPGRPAAAVLGVLARPQCLPCHSVRRRQKRLRRGVQMQVHSEVKQKQPVVTHLAEKAQYKTLCGEHGTIHTTRYLSTEDGIFTAQPQQVPMQIVITTVSLPLAEIKLAPLESRRDSGGGQVWLHP